MIPLIEKTFVEKRKYLTQDELLNIVSVAEATPGVIAINCATYIGYKVLGFIGSLISTIAVSLPSFIIILIISFFYDKFIEVKIIQAIITGLMVSVTFLILSAGIKLFKTAKKDALSYILIAFSLVTLLLVKFFNINFSTIYMILIGGGVSLLVYSLSLLIKHKKEKKEEKD